MRWRTVGLVAPTALVGLPAPVPVGAVGIAGAPIGWAELLARSETYTLVMATNMTVAVATWMRFRGHGRAAVAEMAIAMYAPFIVLFPPPWLGVLSATGLMVLGHMLLLFAVAAAMLRRRDEYT